ncbi:flavin oxidoreductase [Pontibacillus halophilus JSM 076056 = DSM 19796]|uniref:Flavin oxidoreductase n=1 Tax=Pontibacillus halophilus JSM 076056 = DSM 19796 TaxID=1385510 RepID=A0A0A5GQS2_9BACI|nr:flavin reductase family protein [Pontibacillus halophilus]KGX93578.1 flavin oxidoreductase [Pontibacillus halophilus JSM 076056 = DSM 19796]
MLKSIENVKMHSYPGMVAVIGTRTERGVNFMAVGWHAYLSMSPPKYGIAVGRERYTYKALKSQQAFTVNFLSAAHSEFIQLCGTASGVEIEKASCASYRVEIGGVLSAPFLTDAYLVYECEVEEFMDVGDHDWVVASILSCKMDRTMFQENGLPNFSKLQIPLYLGRSTYITLDDKVKHEEYMNPHSIKEKS